MGAAFCFLLLAGMLFAGQTKAAKPGSEAAESSQPEDRSGSQAAADETPRSASRAVRLTDAKWESRPYGGGEGADAISTPQLINYQGRLTDGSGNPLTGTYEISFDIYEVSSGGSPVWSETQTGVTVTDGLFNVILGSVEPIDTLPDGPDCYLEVTVGSSAISPRIRLVSVPYAVKAWKAGYADNADSLGGDAASTYMQTGDAAGGDLDGMYPDPTIAQKSATSGQVLKWDGSAWVPANDSVGDGTGDNAWTRVGTDSVLYTVHKLGLAKGSAGNMLWGDSAFTHVNLGVACTTGYSEHDAGGATVGGGKGNAATWQYSTIAGGYWNHAIGEASTIGGGELNQTSQNYATVGGGFGNIASGAGATVGGGSYNNAWWGDATVGGGSHNQAGLEQYEEISGPTVGGGCGNRAVQTCATIGGGQNNTAGDTYATVAGGRQNTASGLGAAVPGGYGDTVAGDYGLAAGYRTRTSSAADYTFAFGENCSTTTPRAVVFYHSGAPTKLGVGVVDPTWNVDVAGKGKFTGKLQAAAGFKADTAVADSEWATRGYVDAHVNDDNAWTRVGTDSVLYTVHNLGIARGGADNAFYGDAFTDVNFGVRCTVGVDGQNYTYSTIGGGAGNEALRSYATVAGGSANKVSGPYGTVGGGYWCVAGTTYATVAGGRSNYALGEYATVAGGQHNKASGWNAAVAGGDSNTASGLGAAVAGGHQDTVAGDYGLAAGYRTRTSSAADYTFAFGENCSTTTPRAVVFYHSGAPTKLGVGVVDPTWNVDVAGKGKFTGKLQAAAGFKADTTIADSEWATKAYVNAQAGGDNAWERVGSDSVLYTVNNLGIARGGANNMLYGDQAFTDVNFGAMCTVGVDGQNYNYSTIGGGYRNKATSSAVTIAGGSTNSASAVSATVGGGFGNTASGTRATVAGGYYNLASGSYATVAGGDSNVASGHHATVAGGDSNLASGEWATVGGGYVSTASGNYATVGGGAYNVASGGQATVGGGYKDTAMAYASGALSGWNNVAGDAPGDTGAVVAGGRANRATDMYATVAGGYSNTAGGYGATVGGGRANNADTSYATVGGGYSNTGSGWYATVGGGMSNIADTGFATVGGGQINTASGRYATVGGGHRDTASADYATVGGGYYNTASGGAYATVGGGYDNTASNTHATVGGGASNTASGLGAAVAGGRQDTVAGDYGMAAGYRTRTRSAADFTFAFGENCSTETPRAVVFYHSGAPTKLGVGVVDPTWNVDVAGKGKFTGKLQAAAGFKADTTVADSEWATKGYVDVHSGGGTVTSVSQATGVVCTPNPITTTGTVQFDATWGDARYVNEAQTNSVTGSMITDGEVSSADIRDTTVNTAELKDAAVTAPKLNQMGATANQILKWNGSAWAPANDSLGAADNAWERVGSDSVLYTVNNLGIARGGADNAFYGDAFTDVNFGVRCTVGVDGYNYTYSTIGGGYRNKAASSAVTIAGGSTNTGSGVSATVGGGYGNTASGGRATVGGGNYNTASASYATVAGGDSNTASGLGAAVAGGRQDTVAGDYGLAAGYRTRTRGAADYTFAFGKNCSTSTPNAVVFYHSDTPTRLGVGVADPTWNVDVEGKGKFTGKLQAAAGFKADTTVADSEWATKAYVNAQAGGDDAWERVGTDSVLYTVHNLGIAKGGADNVLYGTNHFTHVNLGVACTTGVSGEDFEACVVGGGERNRASDDYATASGGYANRAYGGYSAIAGGSENYASGSYTSLAGGRSNSSGGTYAAVGGGYYNSASGTYATIGGGHGDTAKAHYSGALSGLGNVAGGVGEDTGAVVAGGCLNRAVSRYATVGGGHGNTASWWGATVGGGRYNTATGGYAVVAGGDSNVARGIYSTIGGGRQNDAGWYATVAGGVYDTARGYVSGVLSGLNNVAGEGAYDSGAVVAGGVHNRAEDRYTFVGGGRYNRATWEGATVCGGYSNEADDHCTVGGGWSNTASGTYATVAGGANNYVTRDYSTVGGGAHDSAFAKYSGVFSGGYNVAGREDADSGATVCGGMDNVADSTCAFVGGGSGNTAGNWWSVVGGGYDNYANGPCATIGGGSNNQAVPDGSAKSGATVGGGEYNNASSAYATVAGGNHNTASGWRSTVAGGDTNTASGKCATVGGGHYNAASDSFAVVGGGDSCTASGWIATVAGGSKNTASGHGATVGGGFYNRASDEASAIPGGSNNRALGSHCFAAGRFARANHSGSFVWSDYSQAPSESVHTAGNDQFRVRARGGTWFFSNAGMTTGVKLLSGSNSWESACDSMTKEDFRPVDKQALLEKVAALRVRNYKMKDQNDGTRHIGPVAQDFHNAFGVGETETGINMADADGVALAAIQALYEQNQQLFDQNRQMMAELEALRAELAGLRK